MSEVILVAGKAKNLPELKGDVIGIDKGALVCVENGISMIAAIGDFDSVSESEKTKIAQSCHLIQLPTHKNETDSEAAVLYALEQGYDSIVLYGGLGGRIDHELVNLMMLIHRYPLILVNENNRIRKIKSGTYRIKKEYQYLSFIPLEKSCITLKNVAYPLDMREVAVDDIYLTSNEIKGEAEIIVHEGSFLMIECDDE